MSNALSKHATVHYGTQLVARCRAMLAVILCAWSMIIFGGTAAADTPVSYTHLTLPTKA